MLKSVEKEMSNETQYDVNNEIDSECIFPLELSLVVCVNNIPMCAYEAQCPSP